MKQTEIDKIIRLHKLWLEHDPAGKRANLRDADLRGADLRDANLRDANFQGAYLRDANLRGAYLQDADLRGADLRDANLRDANFQGAYLRGAYLRGAYLQGADFQGAEISRGNVIHAMGWSGLYDYWVFAQQTDQGQFIRMGCKELPRAEWEANFWNNPAEFPDDGSEKSKLRLAAFRYACAWLDAAKK